MMKKAGIALALLILLLGGALFWLHHNLNHLVKNAIETYGSQMTEAKVTVSSVAITTTTGTGIIRGLVVGNPKGFKTPYALKVGQVEVEIDLSTLTHPAILIKKIMIDAPDVSQHLHQRWRLEKECGPLKAAWSNNHPPP